MNHLKTHQTNPTTAQYRPVQSNTSTAQYSQVQPIPELDPKPELFGQIFGIVIQWAKGGIYGIRWDHQVGLMSLQMIHEAYKPAYM